MSKLSTGVWKPGPNPKKTSQSGAKSRLKLSSMNKSKKRSTKPSRGQG